MRVRAAIILAIGLLVSGCRQSVPSGELYFHDKPLSYWLEAVHKADGKTRHKAVEVLGNVGASDPAAIGALVETLKDKDAEIRSAALLALAKQGHAAADFAPQIEPLTKDADARVRKNADLALRRVRGRT